MEVRGSERTHPGQRQEETVIVASATCTYYVILDWWKWEPVAINARPSDIC